MTRVIRSRLHDKLVLAFILVMLIPIVISAVYMLVRSREILIARAQAEQLRLAAARVAEVEGRIADAGADLLLLIKAPTMRRYSQSAARRSPDLIGDTQLLFQAFLQRASGAYTGLCLLSDSGDEQVCVRDADGGLAPTPEADLQRRADAVYVIDAIRHARSPGDLPVAISRGAAGAQGDRAGGTAQAIYFSALFQDAEGRPAGILVLEAPLVHLLAPLIDSADAVRTTIVDERGGYLARSGPPAAADPARTLAQDRPSDAAAILGQPVGTLINTADRPGFFQIFTRISPRGQSAIRWTVIYEQPLDNVLQEVYRTQTVILIITGIGLIVAIVATHLLTRSIVRPVVGLAAAARRVGAGDLLTPVQVQSADEIGDLARTFQATVDQLRETLSTAEQRRREAETLNAAALTLTSTLDLRRVLDRILYELRRVVPYESASVQLYHGDSMEVIGAYGLNMPEIVGHRFSLRAGFSPNAEVVARRAPVIYRDVVTAYPHFNEEPYRADPIRSWMGVPLIFGDRLIGLITLDRHRPDAYDAEHARVALAFAAQAAIAIENARLYDSAQKEIAERRRIEVAQARLTALLEATTDFVGITDMQGRVLFVNRSARCLLGIAEHEPLETWDVAASMPPDRIAWASREILPAVIRDGSWSGESLIQDRHGNVIPVSQVVIAHRGPDGQPEYLSTIIRDLREIKRAEEEQRQAQKMEALGRLAGGLAHDFNNILTVILGESDMLLDEPSLPADLRPGVEQIRDSGARAAALTSQLLAFSRRQVVQPSVIDLNATIRLIEPMLRRLIGEDVLFAIVLAPDLPNIRADPGQIEQVLLNLCINGRDAMPSGGQLEIETAPALVDGDLALQHPGLKPGRYVRLSVCDTGEGIDPTAREHIFEPFFTTKPHGKGTGLGLATVHGIVQQSGGAIMFESAAGVGTTFRIYLPAVYAPAGAAGPAAPAYGHGRGETVLLVEDDVQVRRLARQILEQHGFTVIVAGDGQEALAATAIAGAIDLLLTDIVMPGGLNGVQLAQRLRATRPDLRVIFMSGYSDNTLQGYNLAAEQARYVQKPFAPADLLGAVHALLLERR